MKITLSKEAFNRASYRISAMYMPKYDEQWIVLVEESQKPEPLTGWVRVWDDGHVEWCGDEKPCDLNKDGKLSSRVVFMKEVDAELDRKAT